MWKLIYDLGVEFIPIHILQVWGGVGAVWGFAEVVGLRTPETIDVWRPIALSFGILFLCRFIWQVIDYPNRSSTEHHHDHHKVRTLASYTRLEKFYQLTSEFIPKYILEVWGGVGAVWGFAEVVGLRIPETVYIWRPISLTFGVMFFVRYLYQLIQAVKAYRRIPRNKSQNNNNDDDDINKNETEIRTSTRGQILFNLTIEFAPKLILEVWGSTGAVWGFSEVVGLRRPETIYLWRPFSLTVGIVFLLRYIWQLKEAIKKAHDGIPKQIIVIVVPTTVPCETKKVVDSLASDDLELGIAYTFSENISSSSSDTESEVGTS